MAVKLISLRGMPEDEIEEIRELLGQQGISHYETPAGNWGISMPAFWLRDESELAHCKQLLQQYQQQRYERVHQEYQQRKKRGDVETLFDRIKQQPLRVVLYIAFLLLILYVSTVPFTDIGQ